MNPVDRPLLNIGLTRLEFLRISGKGLAGLTIAPALLSLLGCKQEDIDSGTVGLINTPKGVLVTHRARCTGCHRCERWLSRDILLPYQNPSQLFLWR